MKKTLVLIFSVLALHDVYGQVKGTTAEINAGVDDAKFATALGLQGSKYLDQSGAKLYAVTAAGANTYTASVTPAITAYSAGQVFFIKITSANTSASTLNLNGLGAKTLVKDAATALENGDLLANRIYAVAYDGTNFQVVNVAAAMTGTNLNLSGTATMSALQTTQARPASEGSVAGADWASGIYVSDVNGNAFSGNGWDANMQTVGTFRSSLIRGFQISSETSSNIFKIRSLHTVNPSVWRTLWHDGNLLSLTQLPTRNFSDLQNKPTTLAGYGITDVAGAAIQNQSSVAQAADFRISGSGTLNSLVTSQARPATESTVAGSDWANGIYVSDVNGHGFTGNGWGADMATVGTFRSSLIRGFQISSETASNVFKIRSLHTLSPSTWRTLWHDGNLNSLSQLPTRNFSDLQNKPTTLAGYGITEQLSRFVAQTSAGNGADANYWTKIATINFGAVDNRDCNLELGITGSVGTWGSATIDVGVRQYSAGATPTMYVSVLSAGQGSSWLGDDSFKIVSEGYNSNFDLYVKKNTTYSYIKVFEIISNNNGGTITYYNNQGWSATEPTGTYMASSAGLKYKANNVYHSGNNNILTHPLNGFTVGTNSPVIATDNIKSAIEKLQGQVNNRLDKRNVISDFDTPTGTGILEAGAATTSNQPVAAQWGTGIQFSTNNNPAYAHQLVFTTQGEIYTRNKPGTTFSSWSRMVTSANYNAYSPTLAGLGATGTWGIGITGNAATATTLTTARTINGVAFNGSANITITDVTKEPAIAAGTAAQYQRGDKTWQTLNTTAVPEGTNQYFSTTRVLNTTLTGYTVGLNAVLTAGDTELQAFGKLQGQLNTKANEADVVHVSNNETIAGTKKFTDALSVSFNGSIPAGYKLAVGGNVIAEAVKVKPQNLWPDYVFEKEYPVRSLADLEKFITVSKHLPDVPSAAEVKKEGIDIGEMNAKLLQKIEELTLYMIEKDKQVKKLVETVENLTREVKAIKKE